MSSTDAAFPPLYFVFLSGGLKHPDSLQILLYSLFLFRGVPALMRALFLLAVLLAFGAACLVRLGYWQLARHDELISLARDQATVRTALVTRQGTEIPMDYRMLRRGDRWRIYDVVVERVGLVNNYRTQFDQILRAASYPELVRRIKERSS